MTHTPGPWTFTDHGDKRHREFAIMSETGSVDDNGPGKIAAVFAGFGHHFTFEQAKANARLIAAAPDLLAALIAVVTIADRNTVEFDAAHAAIAKATGE